MVAIGELWVCEYCGQPCRKDETDNDGNPIHEDCAIDRLAAMADARMER